MIYDIRRLVKVLHWLQLVQGEKGTSSPIYIHASLSSFTSRIGVIRKIFSKKEVFDYFRESKYKQLYQFYLYYAFVLTNNNNFDFFARS